MEMGGGGSRRWGERRPGRTTSALPGSAAVGPVSKRRGLDCSGRSAASLGEAQSEPVWREDDDDVIFGCSLMRKRMR
ncbi:hypothetical protein RJT34_07197 [Clitoria ternatea]|uniref:Uncharacterized protein n=1 Tax=Clitoria ternatea TaxID=43366 RepID=A0AAN9PU33_CLITE